MSVEHRQSYLPMLIRYSFCHPDNIDEVLVFNEELFLQVLNQRLSYGLHPKLKQYKFRLIALLLYL